jgi:hypothetical protein
MPKCREPGARGYNPGHAIGNEPARMKTGEWRTIKPRPDVYIHVQKTAGEGPRGGRTKAEHIRYVGSKVVKTIPKRRKR